MTYEEACKHYFEWAKQFVVRDADLEINNPNINLSEEIDGVWHLKNIHGPLAVVRQDEHQVLVLHESEGQDE